MNKVILVGRLASNPQPFTTTTGKTQSRLTLACNDIRSSSEASFFPCVAWQQQANFINTYLKKGDLVSLEGRLVRRSYVGKDGKNNYITEIIVDAINSLGRKNSDVEQVQSKSANSHGSLKSIDESFPETIVGRHDNSEKQENSVNSNTSPEEVEWFDEVSDEN